MSTGPVSRTVKGMLYVAERPDSSPRNQSRCWAKDTGSRAGRCRTARRGGRGLPPVPGSSRASASTVCAAYSSAIPRSTPSSVRTRLTRRVASSECPPRAKKLSSIVTSGRPRISANSAHRACSRGERGARPPEVAAMGPGWGRAARSSLPLAVSGSVRRSTIADGTAWSGRTVRAWRRIASVSTGSGAPSGAGSGRSARSGTTYPIRCLSPEPSSLTAATVRATSG